MADIEKTYDLLGKIEVVDGSPYTIVDPTVTPTSTNPVQSKGIYEFVNDSINIDDVQINGNSIIEDKVANIPIAGSQRLGLVKGKGYVSIDQDGGIFGKQITNNQYPTAAGTSLICKSTLDNRLSLKQDKLTAGQGINITDNVISATGDVTKAYVDQQDNALGDRIDGVNDALSELFTFDETTAELVINIDVIGD